MGPISLYRNGDFLNWNVPLPFCGCELNMVFLGGGGWGILDQSHPFLSVLLYDPLSSRKSYSAFGSTSNPNFSSSSHGFSFKYTLCPFIFRPKPPSSSHIFLLTFSSLLKSSEVHSICTFLQKHPKIVFLYCTRAVGCSCSSSNRQSTAGSPAAPAWAAGCRPWSPPTATLWWQLAAEVDRWETAELRLIMATRSQGPWPALVSRERN
jgi:hypothetical protein